ncbi:MAG: heme-binding protein [Nitrospinaceae bacterium]|nr:heme-binding protein [Nitrospinaceae bacterium]NIR57646.1 heme-binding protein [Nitrospinaceae bacterium]NIS88120.1 heme-binding protein [Nitrospinaceae bacterium]NIT84987.1 heme-binding protein [Nitrospinaceae bacterium]NIU47156.1 heme-binding protein [Nitrospinaceae bacterium]
MKTQKTFLQNLALVSLAILVSGVPVSLEASDDLREEKVLPLSLAVKAASAAVDQCRQDGYKVSAAVVDRGGTLKVLLRADGAGPHTPDSSRKKAYTSASLRRPTMEFADLIVKVPNVQALRDMNDQILMLGGGLPIQFSDDVVGGIGVGGAPGAHLDENCARAGLKLIGAKTQFGKNSD